MVNLCLRGKPMLTRYFDSMCKMTSMKSFWSNCLAEMGKLAQKLFGKILVNFHDTDFSYVLSLKSLYFHKIFMISTMTVFTSLNYFDCLLT